MKDFIILYKDQDSKALDEPKAAKVKASNFDVAEDKFLQKNPDADVLWVYGGTNVDSAIQEYWRA